MAFLKEVEDKKFALEHTQEEMQLLEQHGYKGEEMTNLFMSGELEKAEELGEELLALNSQAFLAVYPFLADVYRAQGDTQAYIDLLSRGFEDILSLFKEDFDSSEHELAWDYDTNRPVYIFLYQYALLLESSGRLEGAEELLRFLVNLNSDDDIGAHYDLLKVALLLGNQEVAKQVLSEFPEDYSPEMLFGKAIAYWQNGEEAAAQAAAYKAAKKYPLMAEEFLKSEHFEPDRSEEEEEEILVESAEYAYDLWVDWQQLLQPNFLVLLAEAKQS